MIPQKKKSAKNNPGRSEKGRMMQPARKAGNTGWRHDGRKSKGKPLKKDAARTKYTGPKQDERKSKGKPLKKDAARTKYTGPKQDAGRTSEIRLNKYIANAGICSRREADQYILAGLVSVNGKIIDKLGTKVFPGDKVCFNNKMIRDEKKVYILMNKPKDCVTTVEDPGARMTVMDILGRKFAERVYPVGRLDRNTTGVLLLTNDGELTQRLTHPSYNKKKIYHVFLDKNFSHESMVKLTKGLELEDGFIRPDAVNYTDKTDKSQIGIELHSGKNRIIRRIFETLGYKILKLDRVYFAGLTKKGLNRGQWRSLTEREINMLKMNAYE